MNPAQLINDWPWRVWLHYGTGRAAWYFPDEDSARVFCVRMGGDSVEFAPTPF